MPGPAIMHSAHRKVSDHPLGIFKCINVVLCNVQAALTVAAQTLDAELQQQDPNISRVLVKIRPGSVSCPALGRYEQVCPAGFAKQNGPAAVFDAARAAAQ